MLQKVKTELKVLYQSLHTIVLSKVTLLVKNTKVLQKEKTATTKKTTDSSKIKGVLALKGIYPETTSICVITYQISSF